MGTAIIFGFSVMLIIDEVFKIMKEKFNTGEDTEKFEHKALRQFKDEKKNLLNSSDASPASS